MNTSMRNAAEAFKSEFVRSVKEHPDDVLPIDEMDELIREVRLELGAFAMETTVRTAIELALATDRSCSCGGKLSIHRRPKLHAQTIHGTFEGCGVSLRCDQCGATYRPAHERLGIGSYSKTSLLFDRLTADFFLDKGAPSAVARLKEHHGIEPGRTTVLRRTEQRGQQARAFLDGKLQAAIGQAEAKRGRTPQVDTVFVQMDSSSGKTVSALQRPDLRDDPDVERTPVRGLPKTKRPVEGKQVKLLCAQPKGALDWVYDAYIGDYEQAPQKLLGLAAASGWQDGVLAVMTADGDEKIREMAEGAFLPDLQFILDQQHALTHLRDVVTYGEDAIPPTQDTDWVTDALEKLRTGQVQQVIAQVREIAAAVEDPKARQKVENVAVYFKKRSDSVHYNHFKAQGWPQGSGAVEGGHINMIHPISKRGAGWLVDNLNHIIALACIRKSGWWDEFWQSLQPVPASDTKSRRAAAA